MSSDWTNKFRDRRRYLQEIHFSNCTSYWSLSLGLLHQKKLRLVIPEGISTEKEYSALICQNLMVFPAQADAIKPSLIHCTNRAFSILLASAAGTKLIFSIRQFVESCNFTNLFHLFDFSIRTVSISIQEASSKGDLFFKGRKRKGWTLL